MQDLPKKINTLTSAYDICYSDDYYTIKYKINENEDDEKVFPVSFPYSERHTEQIDVDPTDLVRNNEFNLEVVRLEDGKFAYRRTLDGKIFPYRYDVATDFNEYGLAMVAKNNMVTFIGSGFHYLSSDFRILQDRKHEINGFAKVSSFSKGSNPLAKVTFHPLIKNKVSYIDSNRNIKKFYEYNGQVTGNFQTVFENGTDFDKDGYAFAGDKLLLSQGYYCTIEYMFKIIQQQKGLITTYQALIDSTTENELKLSLSKE